MESHTMARVPRIPRYRKHTSGQARVTLDGKDFLLGAYNTAASREAYARVVAEWLSRLQAPRPSTTSKGDVTVSAR
jgi:hypothetical protein